MSETLRFDVRGVPELMYGARLEVAKTLRRTAELDPDPAVRTRLVQIAAALETGQDPAPEDRVNLWSI
jgi:hypothetical protein